MPRPYPQPSLRIAEALEGILAVLDREAIPAVHLFGVSNGGMIGQCLVRKCPEKVRTLILFHSMLPSRASAQDFSRRVETLSRLPRWITVSLGYRWLKPQIQAEAPNALPGGLSFWRAYFRKFYDKGTYFLQRGSPGRGVVQGRGAVCLTMTVGGLNGYLPSASVWTVFTA